MLVYNHSVPESTAKDELITVIHSILQVSSEIEKLSRKVAEACPEKGLKKVQYLLKLNFALILMTLNTQNVFEVVDKIPSIAHQLKVVSSGIKKKSYGRSILPFISVLQ